MLSRPRLPLCISWLPRPCCTLLWRLRLLVISALLTHPWPKVSGLLWAHQLMHTLPCNHRYKHVLALLFFASHVCTTSLPFNFNITGR
jgi:hypothetical protein